ncbi:L-threonylcarbamoyladenylate synthase [Oecophyllibacter saccharovorans]|uniref:L-threonylcarbamoyladenylate synthase n=1 Tax=Oecophyllibacter saccharovorans TaxID=2558360 RepID=UPI00116B4A8F|nr:L-threonylcarbamoyladenylate synthase [Oecophyllibacter saccharovorans]TPW34950.1 threonylcarbamoyl-AMP synthase [Oecophyllibacter saccharovorans]
MTGTAPSRQTERLPASYDGIRRAAELLRHGGVVAFGTETVYGLGALSTSGKAVERIYTVKGRPSFNPLISHVATATQAFAEAAPDFPLRALAHQLADAFWPGPLTLVVPRAPTSRISKAVSAGLGSIALRVPQGRIVQELLALVAAPVAAPSANRSGAVSPSTARHVLDGLDGRIDAVLDSGPSGIGVESTIVDLSGERPRLLRPGGITREALEEICGPLESAAALPSSETPSPKAPGQLSSHYAPSLPVTLNMTDPATEQAVLAFGKTGETGPANSADRLVWNLSESGNLAEAAARLYAGLRFLDTEGTRRGLKGIAVQPIPAEGLGEALNDRLKRAAAPRNAVSGR